MADQRQFITHNRPQGCGMRASLALAGLLALTVPLALAGPAWFGASPALAAPDPAPPSVSVSSSSE